MNYQIEEHNLKNLLLDPNNYRFLDVPGYRRVDKRRYHEPSVQKRAYEILWGERGEDLSPLKKSIIANGYVPLEALVVRPHESQENTFVAIEGNRRIAAMQWIVQDHEAGVEIDGNLIASFDTLSIVVIDPTSAENRDAIHILMGIRHVSGIKQWGAYQQAKLIVELMDDLGVQLQETASRLGMSAVEVNRRYRAFRALVQMEEDEEFQSLASPGLYRLFHEAVSSPVTRDWLGWDESKNVFTHEENRNYFYSMIVAHEDDEGNKQEPKLKTYADVRELKKILPNSDARQVLLDPSKTLADTLAVVVAEEGGGWLDKTRSAISAIESLSVRDLKRLSEEHIQLLGKLQKIVKERLDDYKKLYR